MTLVVRKSIRPKKLRSHRIFLSTQTLNENTVPNPSSQAPSALVSAPVSYVAPARESSIVIGTLLGVLILREGDATRRVLAGVAILGGVAALAIG